MVTSAADFVEFLPARDEGRVPMLAPGEVLARAPAVRRRLREAADRVLASGRYIHGDEVQRFEAEAAAELALPFGVGVANGSDALLLALAACGIGAGDQVLLPTYTFVATAGSVARLGAVPRFVDVCPACLTLQPALAEAQVNALTRAIVPVHLFGQLAAMPELLDLARRQGLAVIEDAAQSFGARGSWNAAPVEDSDVPLLRTTSFFPSKNLGGFGDAGLVAAADEPLVQRLRGLREHGSLARYVHHEVSGNHRIDALQAALLRVKLPELAPSLRQRRHNAGIYRQLFAQTGEVTQAPCTCRLGLQDAIAVARAWCDADVGRPLALPHVAERLKADGHTFNQYVVQFSSRARRDAVARALAAADVGCCVYYPRPLHLQPCFSSSGCRSGDFPVAEHASATSLALPIADHLSYQQLQKVVRIVRQAQRLSTKC